MCMAEVRLAASWRAASAARRAVPLRRQVVLACGAARHRTGSVPPERDDGAGPPWRGQAIGRPDIRTGCTSPDSTSRMIVLHLVLGGKVPGGQTGLYHPPLYLDWVKLRSVRGQVYQDHVAACRLQVFLDEPRLVGCGVVRHECHLAVLLAERLQEDLEHRLSGRVGLHHVQHHPGRGAKTPSPTSWRMWSLSSRGRRVRSHPRLVRADSSMIISPW